jgi:hypothetical protein
MPPEQSPINILPFDSHSLPGPLIRASAIRLSKIANLKHLFQSLTNRNGVWFLMGKTKLIRFF